MTDIFTMITLKLISIITFLLIGSGVIIGILYAFNKYEDVIFKKINWQDEIKNNNLSAAIVFSTIIASTVYLIAQMIN